jgi:SAM-dependent methyltransferase
VNSGPAIEAYSRRAEEYVDLLGSIESVHAVDRALIAEWARVADGPLIDVGSGPGHLTEFLREQGHNVRGIEPSSAFVYSARSRFPGCEFWLGDVAALREEDGRFAGVLAWYSLIHLPPEEHAEALRTLSDALRPGGTMLLGFFVGPRTEIFDHAIAPAYFRSIDDVRDQVRAAGLDIVETHTRTGESHRPHSAVIASKELGTKGRTT